MKSIEQGDPAPDFTATDSAGKTVSLADFKGKQVVVLFFYPKDGSPICTQEACSFRDAYDDFVKLGAVVIGVSSDSDRSHREFAQANRLPFVMIADHEGALRQRFGVTNAFFVVPGRITFVIDRNGIVQRKFRSELFGSQHAKEALSAVRKLTGAESLDSSKAEVTSNL